MMTRAAIRARQNCVLRSMPVGSTVIRKADGKAFIVGRPFGTVDIWLMQVDPPRKGTVRLSSLAHAYEVADAVRPEGAR